VVEQAVAEEVTELDISMLFELTCISCDAVRKLDLNSSSAVAISVCFLADSIFFFSSFFSEISECSV
jgi:hypothetical protein